MCVASSTLNSLTQHRLTHNQTQTPSFHKNPPRLIQTGLPPSPYKKILATGYFFFSASNADFFFFLTYKLFLKRIQGYLSSCVISVDFAGAVSMNGENAISDENDRYFSCTMTKKSVKSTTMQ